MILHGGAIDAAAARWSCSREDVLDLSTGVVPERDPTGMAERLARLAPIVGSYGDGNGEPARSGLADVLNVDVDQILIANGAQALIEVLFPALRWPRLAIHSPDYGEIWRCAERFGTGLEEVENLEAADLPHWITDPHGFTGARVRRPDARHGVLDESYAPYRERVGRGVIPGWVRVGSLTKALSIPGMPVGYAIADRELIARLRDQLSPWPASGLALHLLPELLPEWPERERHAEADRLRLTRLIERAGWEARPSEASFVLTRPDASVPDFDSQRILVRRFPEWPQLRDWVRIGIPPSGGWNRLEAALCR